MVQSDLSLYEAHQICDRVENHLHGKGISSVYVHPEPNDKEHHINNDSIS